MLKSKKALAMSVLCAVASVGFVVSVSAAETTMKGNLDEVIVEGSRDLLPGGKVHTNYQAGILGEQKVQDIPFTVVSMSENTISTYASSSQPLPSILSNNPSVRSSASTFYDDISIRGQKLNGYQLYLNGIPGLFAQSTTPVNMLERVDVVAGPAMTTNMATASESAGGLVNMISKRAGEKPISKLTLGFSGKGTFTQEIDVGNRFGNNKEWGIRVNALHQNGETAVSDERKTTSNIFVNIDHRDDNSKTNLLIGYVDESIKDSLRWFTFDKGLSYTPSAPDIHKNYGFKAMRWEADKWLTTLNHEQKISDNWSAFVNAGYGRYDIYNASNSDWRYTIFEDGSFSDSMVRNPFKYDKKSAQIGVKGKVNTGDVEHNLVLAADKYWQKHFGSTSWKFGTVTGTLKDGILTQPDFVPDYPYPSPYLKTKTNYTSYKFVDTMKVGKFDIMAGVIKQKVTNTSIGGKSVKTDGISPLYGIVYKPTDEISVYASHSESFNKGSVITGSKYVNQNSILDPTKTKQNEIGVRFNNDSILANIAVFDVKKANNMDVFAYKEAGVDKYYKTNDGEAEYKGFDISVYGKIAEKWNAMGGLMYVNAKTNKSTGATLDGLRINGVPRWSGVAALEYQPDNAWSILMRGVYSGSFTIKNEEYKLPSYLTCDFGASYKTQWNSVPVTFNAMVYNVFDKAYWESLPGGDNLILSNPRTFMLSATFDL